MKTTQTYLLKVTGNKHEIDAAETQLGYTQEDVDEVPEVDGKRDLKTCLQRENKFYDNCRNSRALIGLFFSIINMRTDT